jgi:hypothetical protein
MRTVLVLVIALATACAKKPKPAATPAAPTESKEMAPPAASPDEDKSSETGDPCDGGETQNKPD